MDLRLKFWDIKVSFDVPEGYFMELEFEQDVLDYNKNANEYGEDSYKVLKSA